MLAVQYKSRVAGIVVHYMVTCTEKKVQIMPENKAKKNILKYTESTNC